MVDAMPGLNFGIPAIIIGHATFCVVVVFNNVVARLRRTSGSIIEASMDLGADGITTFRYVTFPAMRTALMAGGLLAFGLSFDEIIVTIYLAGTTSTLPLWIYTNITRPFNQPEVVRGRGRRAADLDHPGLHRDQAGGRAGAAADVAGDARCG